VGFAALEVLERHVMALTWQDAQILGPVVGFIPVNVMHDFTRLEVAFEDGSRDQAVRGHGTTGNPNSRIWIVFRHKAHPWISKHLIDTVVFNFTQSHTCEHISDF
jgi:hypothetical protein